MATLRILTLHCNETEDNLGPDETVLAVRAGRLRFHKFGPLSMNNGDDWDLNADLGFSNKAVVEVWDYDLGRWPDRHDLLGTHVVNEQQAGEGIKEARFNADGADYVLTYEVV